MDKAYTYLIIEAAHAATHWCTQMVLGIKELAEKKGLRIVEIDVSELEKITTGPIREKVSDNPIIVAGASVPWLNRIIDMMHQADLKSILLGTGDFTSCRNTSVVTLSHEDATMDIIRYLVKAGRRKIAFFAANPRSLTDQCKKKAFYQAAKQLDLAFIADDIIENRGSLDLCIRNFSKSINRYNGVICSNDVSAVALIRYAAASGINIPQDAYVIGFGNTMIGRLISPSLTTATLDYYDIGCRAIDSYIYLRRNPSVSYQSTVVNCRLIPRKSTEYLPAEAYIPPCSMTKEPVVTNASFYGDTSVYELLRLENFLQQLDQVDIKLLYGFYMDKKYNELINELFISESTLKYRLRKMLSITGCANRGELLRHIGNLLGKVNPEIECIR